MKGSFALLAAAAVFDLGSAGPAPRAACNADNCARAVTAIRLGTATRSYHLSDCSSFLSFTVDPVISTETTTTTPSATTVYAATVTHYQTIVSETAWATTINTEIYSTTAAALGNNKRVATGCPVASTIRPTRLPAYAASACSASSRFSSACSCAGVTPRYTTNTCYTAITTVTAPPATTITETATSTVNQDVFVTKSISSALVDEIRCGDLIQIGEDLPAYKIVCEAQGTGSRTLLETLNGTDWDNCSNRATHLGAYDWEFDLNKNVCSIYDRGGNHNVTAPKSRNVYAYIYEGP